MTDPCSDHQVQFQLLGPLRVLHEGAVIPVDGGKLRTLLACLLLSANRTVLLDELVDRLWDTRPPAGARDTVRAYIMRLRHRLGDSGRPLIRSQPNGYLIQVSRAQFDVARFRDLVGRAAVTSDLDGRLAVLDEAIGLWRGPALADVPSRSLRSAVTAGLDEARLEALRSRGETGLRLGRHRTMLDELTGLTRCYPLYEPFWGLLMVALYRSGRQGDSLATYRRMRRLLRDELAVDPSRQAEELHRAVLAHDERSLPWPVSVAGDTVTDRPAAAGLPSAGVPEVAVAADRWPVPSRLPALPADLMELPAERVRLALCLIPAARPRVVVLWGGLGSGKTTAAVGLAGRMASSYPDGQWYVSMTDENGEPADLSVVLADILVSLGLPRAAIPSRVSSRAGEFRARIMNRRILFLIDDVQDASQVVPLMSGAGQSAFLICSRGPLRDLCDAERHYQPRLSQTEAVAMLRRRLPVWAEKIEEPTLKDLAASCDGLPLAVGLLGARLHGLRTGQLGGLVRHLADPGQRLDEFAVGSSGIRGPVSEAYQRLSSDARLALHAVAWREPKDQSISRAGSAVCGGAQVERRVMDELLSAGLVEQTDGDPSGRYRQNRLFRLCLDELPRR